MIRLHNDFNKHNMIVKTIIKKLETNKISSVLQILKRNPHEKIVPFNTWFNHNKIYTNIIEQNNQLLRLRYYDNYLLTPIAHNSDINMTPIKKFLNNMTAYQPYYPETYYDMWELLYSYNIESSSNKLFIINELGHGLVESTLMYEERSGKSNSKNDTNNRTDVWYSGGEIFNLMENYYNLNCPQDKVLKQTYNFDYLSDTKNLKTYDTVIIDTLHKMDNLTVWSTEGIDIINNLFYLAISLNQLSVDGTLIIKLNMLGREHWDIIINIIEKLFKIIRFFKPSIHNLYNPYLYIYASNYKQNNELLDMFRNQIEYQFRMKNYQCIMFDYDFNKNNLIKKYYSYIQGWSNNMHKDVNDNNDNNCGTDLITQHKYNENNESYSIGHILISKLSNTNKLDILSNDSTCSNTTAKTIILIPREELSDQDWEVDASYQLLLTQKSRLNYTKRVMDNKPNTLFMTDRYKRSNNNYKGFILWEKFTERFYPLSGLIQKLRSDFSAQFVTNAWMKLFEMINYYWKPIFSKYSKVNSFHICEAPGAFISASNHIFSTRNIPYNWCAQTLHTTVDNLALEDRFGLIKKYPNKWLFGPTISERAGDVTVSANIKYYKEKLGSNINFITADGGFYCEPSMLNMQEETVAKIIFGELITIFACLKIGGNAIIKMFLPLATPLTISLIYLMHKYFESVTYSKPISSGSSNSEIYLLLKNYRGIKQIQLDILYEMLDDPNISSETFIVEITNGFLQKYYLDVSQLIDRQIDSLNNIYYYYYNQNEQIPESTYNIDNWFEDNNIVKLSDEQKL